MAVKLYITAVIGYLGCQIHIVVFEMRNQRQTYIISLRKAEVSFRLRRDSSLLNFLQNGTNVVLINVFVN
jgi:hypothetical protein